MSELKPYHELSATERQERDAFRKANFAPDEIEALEAEDKRVLHDAAAKAKAEMQERWDAQGFEAELTHKCFVCGDTRHPDADGLCQGCDYPKD
jgi:hypothetical protein